jgi:probable addiction module antidote protein
MRELDFEKELLKSLQDPQEAAAYLQAAILEADPDNWLIALRTLAKAKGGLALLAQKTGLHRVHLYRMLGKEGNPTFKSMIAILQALGVQIKFSSIGPEPVQGTHKKIRPVLGARKQSRLRTAA